jgi:hypothetical protein
MMALLALPMARDIAPEIARCEREFAELTASMASSNGADHERRLLDRLIQLAARIERLSAATSYRFGAGRGAGDRRQEPRHAPALVQAPRLAQLTGDPADGEYVLHASETIVHDSEKVAVLG